MVWDCAAGSGRGIRRGIIHFGKRRNLGDQVFIEFESPAIATAFVPIAMIEANARNRTVDVVYAFALDIDGWNCDPRRMPKRVKNIP